MAFWRSGLTSGIRMAVAEPVLGLKRLVLPVSYWRAVEFSFAVRALARLPRGARVLDVGSPKELALFCAERFGVEVTATDILQEEIDFTRRIARAQALSGCGPGLVHAEVQDGRALMFADGTFDSAFSISVLEHIPHAGDTEAMRELLRVVRPGGRVVVTVPYAEQYHEVFVSGPVFERRPAGNEPVFFERHYDAVALTRLTGLPDARLETLELWGERWMRVEALLERLGRLRNLLAPLEGPLAAASLRCLRPGESGRPMAAFFVLEKR
jgi:SAM-dependent methyltransferase